MTPKERKVVFILVAFGNNCDNVPNSEMFDHTKLRAKSTYLNARMHNKELSIRIARQVSAKKIQFYESVVRGGN